jgi:hypothetical protein
MTAKAIVLTALVVFALCVPGFVASSDAIPLPSYFDDEWVGLLCLTVTLPGPPPAPVSVLVQVNFDKSTNGGISLAEADQFFAFLTDAIVQFGPLAGGTNPQNTCPQFTPGNMQAQFPGLNALQAAQALTGTFQQHGFFLYVIADAFLNGVPPYLVDAGIPEDTLTLRTDAFLVNGSNDITYSGSLDVLRSLIP